VTVPSNVSDLEPRGSLVLIEPFRPDGFVSGFYIEYRETLYPVLGRVLRVGPDVTEVRPGEVVHYRPLNYTDATRADGSEVFFIEEKAIGAVVDGYDQAQVAVVPSVDGRPAA